ncbi:hypothetical protein Kpho02_69410 [Kitasatospora phosalacinea]|uniref:Amidohydrolase-related domain-containing protein n=1 Tax=Kitasatospora phosalacinea TaxID=2065 RepID=A0A9W6V5U5_9ACTN|nr:amidohydrolase family protein [Kitasatospora phosalacinea]GLW74643.1 hypothetical protein Kpho02_69410 [Kitasatospora phosalacinea]
MVGDDRRALLATPVDARAGEHPLLANNHGTYPGADGQDVLWQALDDRSAVAFVHPAELPAQPVSGIPAFAAYFLLDTTRAAYLLVRNGILRRYPNIRFILSHAGGFLPYASHRMAVTLANDTARSPLGVLDDFRSFYFDTALSSSPAALPTLLAFARPGHVLFGSGWPFAPTPAGQYFANGLDTGVDPGTLTAVNRTNAQALFPRLATTRPVPPPTPPAVSELAGVRHHVRGCVHRSGASASRSLPPGPAPVLTGKWRRDSGRGGRMLLGAVTRAGRCVRR